MWAVRGTLLSRGFATLWSNFLCSKERPSESGRLDLGRPGNCGIGNTKTHHAAYMLIAFCLNELVKSLRDSCLNQRYLIFATSLRIYISAPMGFHRHFLGGRSPRASRRRGRVQAAPGLQCACVDKNTTAQVDVCVTSLRGKGQ